MARFHVNDEGNVGRCSATKGNCRFGSDDEHSNSKSEARAKAEEKLSVEFPALKGLPAKRPIDHLVNLLFVEPLPMPRDMKRSIPDVFKESRFQHDAPTSNSAPESAPTATSKASTPEDNFAEFVAKIEKARNESLPETELSQAAWEFNRSRVFDREIPIVDASFKSFYNDARIENSNLTLQGWKPKNPTHDYIVKELASGVLTQHIQCLENDGIREDPFVTALSSNSVTSVETVGRPQDANPQLQKVSDFSNGCISGLIDATERAKVRSFPNEESQEGRENQLQAFLSEEAALYEMAYQEDQSDFNDGRAWMLKEYLGEDN